MWWNVVTTCGWSCVCVPVVMLWYLFRETASPTASEGRDTTNTSPAFYQWKLFEYCPFSRFSLMRYVGRCNRWEIVISWNGRPTTGSGTLMAASVIQVKVNTDWEQSKLTEISRMLRHVITRDQVDLLGKMKDFCFSNSMLWCAPGSELY